MFIVIEGTDGSGKSVQTKLLVERLMSSGHHVAVFDFPQYESPSSFFVQEYLNGRYGTIDEVSAKQASLCYAMDRFHVGKEIRAAVQKGKTIVCNRYVASNMGHQGAKMNADARTAFYEWLYEIEFGVLNIPKPDVNIILHMPPEMGQLLVDRKGKRDYTESKRDLHEGDLNHLRNSEQAYLGLVNLFPDDFTLIECVEDGKILPPRDIHDLVWKSVESRY